MIGAVMLDLQAEQLSSEEKELLQHPNVGGVILFSRNYFDLQQLRHLISNIRKTRSELLVAVDQEGGRVQRFKNNFTLLPPLANFGKAFNQNREEARTHTFNSAKTMAEQIVRCGIDFSFAPVLDVDLGKSTIIGDRSFNSDPKIVYQLANEYISGMNSAGMHATGKHFPGHGAVSEDSHTDLPIDHRDFEVIWEKDLFPYRMLENKLSAIMMAHVLYPNIDSLPASFSKIWIQKILRDKIKFFGAIFSDDLSMQGANIVGDHLTRAETALDAGCDMIIVCNNRQQTIKVVEQLRHKMTVSSRQRLERMKAYNPPS